MKPETGDYQFYSDLVNHVLQDAIPTPKTAFYIFALIQRNILCPFTLAQPHSLPKLLQEEAHPLLGNEYRENDDLARAFTVAIIELHNESFDYDAILVLLYLFCSQKVLASGL
jgi:hypothetical protein